MTDYRTPAQREADIGEAFNAIAVIPELRRISGWAEMGDARPGNLKRQIESDLNIIAGGAGLALVVITILAGHMFL